MLFRNADIAFFFFFKQKTAYEIYDASRDQYSRDRMSLVDDLRKAIDRRQLVLYYQPVVELRTGRCADVEALVRWQHPERGMIAPNEFLPMFERLRLMRDLSSWAIETALRQSTAWREDGVELDVTVNLAAQNLADAELARVVRDSIDRSKAPARLSSRTAASSDRATTSRRRCPPRTFPRGSRHARRWVRASTPWRAPRCARKRGLRSPSTPRRPDAAGSRSNPSGPAAAVPRR